MPRKAMMDGATPKNIPRIGRPINSVQGTRASKGPRIASCRRKNSSYSVHIHGNLRACISRLGHLSRFVLFCASRLPKAKVPEPAHSGTKFPVTRGVSSAMIPRCIHPYTLTHLTIHIYLHFVTSYPCATAPPCIQLQTDNPPTGRTLNFVFRTAHRSRHALPVTQQPNQPSQTR
jgi:hypothetical protein